MFLFGTFQIIQKNIFQFHFNFDQNNPTLLQSSKKKRLTFKFKISDKVLNMKTSIYCPIDFIIRLFRKGNWDKIGEECV